MDASRLSRLLWYPNEGVPSFVSHLALTEAKGPEDDCFEYTAGLVEEIAHSMLCEEEDPGDTGAADVKAAWVPQTQLSCSPQSTLSGMKYWSKGLRKGEIFRGYSSVSSLGVSSPPSPLPVASQVKEDTLDLLYVELMRLKMKEEIRAIKGAELSAVHASSSSQSSNLSCLPKALWSHGGRTSFLGAFAGNESCGARNEQKNGAGHCYSHHQHRLHAVSNSRSTNGAVCFPSHSYQASPSCHQPAFGNCGSGMQAVFLGRHGARESGGTGVFLPRRTGNKAEGRKKPACSTVLLPTHIVQALNFNIQDTLACPGSSVAASYKKGSATVGSVNKVGLIPGSSVVHTCPAVPMGATASATRGTALPMSKGKWAPPSSQLQESFPDVNLPPEWTY